MEHSKCKFMLLEVKGKRNCAFKEWKHIQKYFIPKSIDSFHTNTHNRITAGFCSNSVYTNRGFTQRSVHEKYVSLRRANRSSYAKYHRYCAMTRVPLSLERKTTKARSSYPFPQLCWVLSCECWWSITAIGTTTAPWQGSCGTGKGCLSLLKTINKDDHKTQVK